MKRITDPIVIAIFLMTEVILYIMFLAMDVMQISSTNIKYLTICLCFAMALYFYVRQHTRLLLAAMALTLIADTFLLLRNDEYLIGVLAFCMVQILYAIRLASVSGKSTLVFRVFLFLVCVVLLWYSGNADGLTVASVWSYTWLFINSFHACLVRNQQENGKVFAGALLLFLCCDTCVGLHNLLSYIPQFPFPDIIPAATFCMWLFYLPSQILIILSFYYREEETK